MLFVQGMLLVTVCVCLELSGPFIVNLLLTYLEDCDSDDDDDGDDTSGGAGGASGGGSCGLEEGLFYVALLAATQLTNAMVRAHSMYWIKQVGG